MSNDDIRIPKSICPKCGKTLDATTDAYGHHRPKEGDISICLYCGALGVFNSDLSLRLPTTEELATFKADPRVIQADIVRASVVAVKQGNMSNKEYDEIKRRVERVRPTRTKSTEGR